MLRTFRGQETFVKDIALLPDGRRFLSVGDNGSMWLWDVDNGQVIRKYANNLLPVNGIAVTKDGRRAVACSYHVARIGTKPGDDVSKLPNVEVWYFEIESGKELQRLSTTAAVPHIALSPDSRYATFGTSDGVALWDLNKGTIHNFTGAEGLVVGAIFTLDGRHILGTGYDRALRIWDVATGQMVANMPTHTRFGVNVSIAPDGRRAGVVGWDTSASVWELPGNVVSAPFNKK